MSQSEADETIQDLAESHPEYSINQFTEDFNSIIGRDPTSTEKRKFLKMVKSTKSSTNTEGDTNNQSDTNNANFQTLSSGLFGRTIQGYFFLEVLGKGSFGEVYRCKKGGKEYAAKCIDETQMSSEIEQAFADSISARLNSKFLIRYFDKFRGPSKELYVIMELCPQGDLRALIETLKRLKADLKPDRIVKILIQLLIGLEVMHANKILHRDLKPENVLVDKDDNIKIGDFGCSKELDTTSAKAATMIGTPVYESPQVVNGEQYDSAADMWALGVLMYELCMLVRPFEHTVKLRLYQLIIAGTHERIPGTRCPAEIVDLIESLLTVDAKKRPSALFLLQRPFIRKYAERFQLLQYFPPSALVPIINTAPILPSVAVSTPSKNNPRDISISNIKPSNGKSMSKPSVFSSALSSFLSGFTSTSSSKSIHGDLVIATRHGFMKWGEYELVRLKKFKGILDSYHLDHTEVFKYAKKCMEAFRELGREKHKEEGADKAALEIDRAMKTNSDNKTLCARVVCDTCVNIYSQIATNRPDSIGFIYQEINTRLRSVGSISDESKETLKKVVHDACGTLDSYVFLLWEGLKLMFSSPKEQECVYRGIRIPTSAYLDLCNQVNKYIIMPAFSSFSEDKSVAYGFPGTSPEPETVDVILKLYPFGRPMIEDVVYKGVKYKREVLIHPFSAFRVLSASDLAKIPKDERPVVELCDIEVQKKKEGK